ncbi:MAG: efflux RND transporter periplasmic adaptor subunit, partial [Pseudomonadota bacterium]
AGEQPLLTIADYSKVWADLDVFPGDARTIQPGQAVTIRMNSLSTLSSILYLNPGAGDTPNVVARVPLDNASSEWTPGLLVEADVVVAETPVPLLINNLALQTFRDWQVVFIKVGNEYEIRPLELGRTDGRFTEVLSGLNAGDEYVVVNSYLLKADLEKSGASHDH